MREFFFVLGGDVRADCVVLGRVCCTRSGPPGIRGILWMMRQAPGMVRDSVDDEAGSKILDCERSEA